MKGELFIPVYKTGYSSSFLHKIKGAGLGLSIVKHMIYAHDGDDKIKMATSLGKILVVDDDNNLLEIIKMRLESANYEVVTVLEEEDAIKAVKEKAFDLSIIDLQLAKRNGISVMEDVHKIAPNIPVIILTAYGSIESAVEAMQKGAYIYMTKPFDSRELLFQIRKALGSSRRSY